MIRTICAGIACAGLVFAALPASAEWPDDETGYTGTLFLTSFDFCPVGSAPALGQQLDPSQFSALFSLIGNNFGGDGRNTFNLPNLRDEAPVDGMQYCIVIDGIYPQRN